MDGSSLKLMMCRCPIFPELPSRRSKTLLRAGERKECDHVVPDKTAADWRQLKERSRGAQRIPALTSLMAAMIPGVSQPEIQRQVRQQRADIDALYELVERVDQKVDALDVKIDRRFDEINSQLSGLLRQLGGR